MAYKTSNLEETILAYREFFESEAGQLVLADLISYFCYNRGDMYQPGMDALHLANREGKRSVLIHINQRLEADPADAREIEETQSYV